MGQKEVSRCAARAGHEDGCVSRWLIRCGPGARSVGSPGSRGHHGALRTWVRQARDRIRAPGPGSPGGEDAERIKECEKEVRQLRRASAILKERVGLSIAAECGRPSR